MTDQWKEISGLYNDALKLPENERAAFLKEHAPNEDIRIEVESLLANEDSKEQLLDSPALEVAAKMMAKESPVLMTDQTLNHYQVTCLLGKGGMGEVYQAKDQKLGRDVAIKILPEEFAWDSDRVARFQREAKLLASLNHPNIAAIYGLEEAGGTQFLVLELVEGETLSDRLKRGPIPVEESLKLAIQIAEALEAAHGKGIIHRDLKPVNIKVTPDDKVKVLDFGLAKVFTEEQGEERPSDSPKMSSAATRQGVILGTAAYMSPEQVKGKTVDKRTDIWAFGIVLYEMLSGRQLFASETVPDTLASVLTREPDLEKVPAGVRHFLHRCLQKDPTRRPQHIGDLRLELEEILANAGDDLLKPLTAVGPGQAKLRMILPWVAVAVVLTVIIGGVALWRSHPPDPRQVIRYDYELPESRQFSFLGDQALAVSGDGSKIVYSTDNGLYLHSLDELTDKLIPGTEGSTSCPFFSADGKWIIYSGDKLKKIATSGGLPLPLSDSVGAASWAEDGTIVFSQSWWGIKRISDDGRNPELIVKPQSGRFFYPQILPDGKFILYTYRPITGLPKIMVQSLKTGESREITTGIGARYISTGHLIYRVPDSRNVVAVRFDPLGLRVIGEPVLVLERVIQFAVSESGTLVYIPETAVQPATGRTLVWVDREGKEEPLSVEPMDYYDIRISPDGERVALHETTGGSKIYVWDMVRENMMQLAEGTTPLWTPDGKRILFSWDPVNPFLGALYWKAADGTGKAEKLASIPNRGLFPCSWSKDGKTLALWEVAWYPFSWDIGTLSMEGDHIRQLLLKENYKEFSPLISPDGTWMAYTSNESGRFEIYVRPFPDVKGGKWKVSTNGGNCPLWSPDGHELYYRNENAVMAVPMQTGVELKPGKPKVLFRGTLGKIPRTVEVEENYAQTYWDISPKDGRFLMIKDHGAEYPHKIIIVVNWLEELKQKVPIQ